MNQWYQCITVKGTLIYTYINGVYMSIFSSAIDMIKQQKRATELGIFLYDPWTPREVCA